MTTGAAPCRFGYVEYDGYQYCFAHGGFRHYVEPTMRCDRARDTNPSEPSGLANDDATTSYDVVADG